MSEVRVLSASQVDTYRSCSLKWHYRYIEKAPEEQRSAALVVGQVVDVALKNAIHDLKDGVVSLELLDPLPYVERAWEAELAATDVPIHWGKGDERKGAETAGALVKAFLEVEDLPERVARIEALDVRFELPVLDPDTGRPVEDLVLVGILDAVERTDGDLRPLDFKTAASRAGYDESSLATHLQGSLYVDALRRLHPDEAGDEMAFWVGLKLKTPVLEDRVITITEAARRRAVLTVLHAHRAMALGVAFPQPSFLCGGCAYAMRCERWGTTSRLSKADPFAQ